MTDPITRLNAALEGRYRVEREIGEGGMATVYLAEDLRHNRNVALKVLKPELAAVVGAEHFLAEIKTTANLQHPHILALYDRIKISLKLRRNATVSGRRGERQDGALDHSFGERHLVRVLRQGHRSCHGSLANPTG